MLPFFPMPYPDETLYSVLSRYHMYSGNLRFVHTMNDLFGKETVGINLDFISSINLLLERIQSNSLTTDSLIYNHSMLPYFAPFIPVDRVGKAKKFMKENNGLSAHLPLGINGFGIKNSRHFRHCTKCIQEDMNKFGETYWHRVHQLPGVFICPKHKQTLVQYNKMFKEMRSRELIYANEDMLEHSTEVRFSIEHADVLTKIAEESQWLLSKRITINNTDFYSNRYLAKLQNMGIATVSGKIKRQKWLDLFSNVYDEKLLALLQSTINMQKKSNWINQIVRNRENAFHPIRHILIILLFSNSLKEFYSKQYKYTPFGDGPWPCLNYVHTHYREKTISKVIIKDTLGRPSGTFACHCGFIYSRRGPDKNESDLFKRGRIVQYGLVWERKFEELLRSNISETKMAEILGVSRGTVKNKKNHFNSFANKKFSLKECRDKAKEMRARWINLIELHPGKTLFQLSKLDRRLHYWLYKNDYPWMKENTPTKKPKASVKTPFNWEAKDEELLAEVKSILSNWHQYEINSLKRISKNSIARKTISSHFISKHADKIPKTINFIEPYIESEEDFRIRKLDWAYKKLLKKDENLTVTTLLKESKISSQSLTSTVKNVAKSIINKN